jgi:LCP family protein required for cell wall assembly
MTGAMRKLLAATLALSAWVGGTVVGSIGTAPSAAGGGLLQVGRAHAEFEPVLDGKEPIFILILGSDARPGTSVERGLADSIHILGINPVKRRATLLGFPRDAYVPLSTGGTNKINSAMPQGGPQAMVATIERLTGIQIDYYALTGFGGVSRAIDQIGGLTVNLPAQLVGYTKTFPAGEQRLEGRDALQVARTRKSLQNGDFGRSANQGVLLISALAQFRKEFAKDPNRMFVWLGAGLRNVQTDLSIGELSTLAFTAMTVRAEGVTNIVVPGTTATIGGMSVVQLSPTARALYNDLKADGIILKARGSG